MIEDMQVIRPRGGLSATRQAIASGELTIGFLGGSITAEDPAVGGMTSNWPKFIRGFFLTQYPRTSLRVYNAGIGGTCSLSGLMRADQEIIAHGCDLVFIEYAVNDDGVGPYERSREGLIRKLLQRRCDVVAVYTYNEPMYADMLAGKAPDTVAAFERLAEHYCLPSVWMGLHAFRQIAAGRLSWEEFLPESGGRLHPLAWGSSIYAEPVIDFLRAELSVCAEDARSGIPYGAQLPLPLCPLHYQNIREIPMDSWVLKGPWVRQRVLNNPWYSEMAVTDSVEASLAFRFVGKMLAVALDYGQCCAVLRWRIDGGDWQETGNTRHDWMPMRNWTMTLPMTDDLSSGEHLFEMTPIHGDRPGFWGTECRLYSFVTVK